MKITYENGEIVVTDPDTGWSATYLPSKFMNKLALTKVAAGPDADPEAEARFLEHASRLAFEWARAMGWTRIGNKTV